MGGRVGERSYFKAKRERQAKKQQNPKNDNQKLDHITAHN